MRLGVEQRAFASELVNVSQVKTLCWLCPLSHPYQGEYYTPLKDSLKCHFPRGAF